MNGNPDGNPEIFILHVSCAVGTQAPISRSWGSSFRGGDLSQAAWISKKFMKGSMENTDGIQLIYHAYIDR